MRLQSDLSFGHHPQQKLDLYLPDGPGPFPVVLCVHGGGWRNDDKVKLRGYADLLTGAGLAAVSTNYRLAPDSSHPAQEEDVFSVLAWIAREGPKQGLDPERVGLTGASAGAHLITLVGLKATRPGAALTRCRLRAMMPICGVFDIAAWVREIPRCSVNAEALLGGSLAAKETLLRDASPCHHVHRDAPPCLLVHGDHDEIVPCSQSLRFAEALTAAGAKVRCELVVGGIHGTYEPSGQVIPVGGAARFVDFFRASLSASR